MSLPFPPWLKETATGRRLFVWPRVYFHIPSSPKMTRLEKKAGGRRCGRCTSHPGFRAEPRFLQNFCETEEPLTVRHQLRRNFPKQGDATAVSHTLHSKPQGAMRVSAINPNVLCFIFRRWCFFLFFSFFGFPRPPTVTPRYHKAMGRAPFASAWYTTRQSAYLHTGCKSAWSRW